MRLTCKDQPTKPTMNDQPSAPTESFDTAYFQKVYAALRDAVLGASKGGDGMGMVHRQEALSAMAALTAALAVRTLPIDTPQKAAWFAEDHGNVIVQYVATLPSFGLEAAFMSPLLARQ
jgi:hypothetical protein